MELVVLKQTIKKWSLLISHFEENFQDDIAAVILLKVVSFETDAIKAIRLPNKFSDTAPIGKIVKIAGWNVQYNVYINTRAFA